MTRVDGLYLALIAVLSVVDHFVIWRTFVGRSQADPAGARRWLWSSWMVLLWAMAGAGAALWLSQGRALGLLGFTVPNGWRLWSAIGLLGAYAIMSARPIIRIARQRRTKRVRISNDSVGLLVPRTGTELAHWAALSLTAGFCEEFVYRGYLIVVLQPLIGLWGAAAISLLAFALAHSYQGLKGVLSVAMVGGVFTLVVLIFGSLWPAIALHALVDVCHGLLAWVALREMPGNPAPVAATAGVA